VAVMVAVSKRNGEIEVGGVNGCGERERVLGVFYSPRPIITLFFFLAVCGYLSTRQLGCLFE